MVKFVIIAVDYNGNVYHCVHYPTHALLHSANLVIVPSENCGLRVWKDREGDQREVTPDEAHELVEKYIKFGKGVQTST